MNVSLVHFTPERFFAPSQVGLIINQDWDGIAHWLTAPTKTDRTDADAKKVAGAWCPCVLKDGVVYRGQGPFYLFAADVDDVGSGGFERTVEALRGYQGVVVTSANATEAQPKHRFVLTLSAPLSFEDFPVAWLKLYRTMAAAGISLDRTCKNPNRLYFAPVRKEGGMFRAERLEGEPVDMEPLLEIARREASEFKEIQQREFEARKAQRTSSPSDRARYIEGALRKASEAVACAGVGERHGMLFQEAYGLSRFGLSEGEISDALIPAFIYVAGESRRREGANVIRDAVRARSAGVQ